MSETCSVCGDESVVGVVPIRTPWERYLLETTGLRPTASQYFAPICQSCHARFSALRMNDEHGSADYEDTVLDDLDTDRLLDDPKAHSGEE